MIKLNILSPNGTITENQEVEYVTLPTEVGVISVFENHEPLIGIVKPGLIIITKSNKHQQVLSVSGGIVNIERPNVVYILADIAEKSEDIDENAALEAKAKAEEYMKSNSIDDEEYEMIQSRIDQETARINAIRVSKQLPNVQTVRVEELD